MRRARSASYVVPVVAPLVLALTPSLAQADGMFLPSQGQAMADAARPSAAAQKAVIIQEGGEEVLLLQTTYRGPAAAFAWVVPVPSVPTEVFEAEPCFVEQVLLHTSPRVVSKIAEDPSARADRTMGAEGGGAEASGVTVHQRMAVGEFDAAVLSAAGGQALQQWLEANHYAVPAEAAGVLDRYVQRGWAFVAVKLLSEVAQQRSTLTDVPPLGIRFPAAKLVYPLEITRGSAGPWTSLVLCLIADGPVDCDTMPSVWLEATPLALDAGATYGTLRRQLTRAGNGPALLCEYSMQGPLRYVDLSYRGEDWAQPAADTGLTARHATRFFGLLRREELRDLEFTPAPQRPNDYRVLMYREGQLNAAAQEAWSRERDAVRQPQAGGESARHPGQVGVAAASSAGRTPPWALLALCLGGLALVGAAVRLRSHTGRGAAILLAALILVAAIQVGRAGSGRSELEGMLKVVDSAVADFVRDCGCYPASLEDLAAREAPTAGLDASGNEVPLGGTWRGPYLDHVPQDLLGVQLAYDVLNLRPVDSGGFGIVVAGANSQQVAACEQAVYGRGRDPDLGITRFWHDLDPEVHANYEAYAKWLQGQSPGALLVGSTLESDGHTSFGRVPWTGEKWIVADVARGEAFSLSTRAVAVEPETGRATTAYYLGAGAGDGVYLTALRGTTAEGALVAATRRPLTLPIARARLHPDGRTLAVWGDEYDTFGMGRLAVLHPDGRWQVLATGCVFQAEFDPDGESLYVLGWLGARADEVMEAAEQPGARPARGHGDETICDLYRVYTTGGEPELVMSDVLCTVLSVAEPGVLVLDREGDLVRLPLGGAGAGDRLDVPAEAKIVAARLFPEGVLFTITPVNQYLGSGTIGRVGLPLASSPRGTVAPFSGEHCRPHIALLGLQDGWATVAWHADLRASSPWVVKRIGPNGEVKLLPNRGLSEDEKAWEPLPQARGGGTSPTAGAEWP